VSHTPNAYAEGFCREECTMNAILAFFREESAATAVEYAVMLALILVTIIVTISAVGSQTGGMWGRIDTEMQAHGF
jgi:pilus assembly protein Flp/PilA